MKVRCMKPDDTGLLTQGKVYEAEENGFGRYKLIADDGFAFYPRKDRFEPVVDEPAPAAAPAWSLDAMTAQQRKESPLFRGLFRYFPDALVAVAHVSFVGNQQHNPGQELHWAKHKSTDEGDALLRHQLQAGTVDTDGLRHSAKVAWRALAQLQREIDAAGKA